MGSSSFRDSKSQEFPSDASARSTGRVSVVSDCAWSQHVPQPLFGSVAESNDQLLFINR